MVPPAKVLLNPERSVDCKEKTRTLNQSASQQTLKAPEAKPSSSGRLFSFDNKNFFTVMQAKGKGSPVFKGKLGSTQKILINIVDDSLD